MTTSRCCIDCGRQWAEQDGASPCPGCGSLNVGVFYMLDYGELYLGVVRDTDD